LLSQVTSKAFPFQVLKPGRGGCAYEFFRSCDSGPAVRTALMVIVVRKAAGSLRFGVIQIKVHDGEVVQIETTEKLRLDHLSPESESLPTAHVEAYPNKSLKANSHQTPGGIAKESRK